MSKTTINKEKEKFKKDNPNSHEDEAYLCAYKEKYDNTKEIRLKAYDVIIRILKIKCHRIYSNSWSYTNAA